MRVNAILTSYQIRETGSRISTKTLSAESTTSVDENGDIVGIGNAYEQTKYIFQKIEKYLKEAGSSLENVVWNRMYVTDISKWEDIGRAHAEFFKDIKPCATMVEVKGFIHPDMIVEIETEAIAD